MSAAQTDAACPACAKPSRYDPGLDRYFHADGSGNDACWLTLLRGLTGAEQAETHPCECPVCRCPNAVGGSLWEGADGSCWDCWHGTHGPTGSEVDHVAL